MRRNLDELAIRRRSAGVVILRDAPNEVLCLLLRLYANWDFPKGEIEPGEDPLAAAIREVQEETTIVDLEFRWGYGFRETVPYNAKVARYYVAEVRSAKVSLPVNPELGHPEHHEFRWMSYRNARKVLPDRLLPILAWAYDTAGVPKQSVSPDRI